MTGDAKGSWSLQKSHFTCLEIGDRPVLQFPGVTFLGNVHRHDLLLSPGPAGLVGIQNGFATTIGQGEAIVEAMSTPAAFNFDRHVGPPSIL